MSVKFSPWGNQQFFDENGDPAVGWKINTYIAGSSTPATTYTTSVGNVAQTNPIIINSLGFPTTGQIWLTEGVSYKFVLTNAADVVKKTEDNISGVNDAALTVSEWITGTTPTFISATSFSIAGDQTTVYHVGRRIKTTNSGGTIYSTISASAFTGGGITTLDVQNDSGTLDGGLSAVAYGILSYVNPSNLLSNLQVFTSNGTWTKPAGAKIVEVICIGGGGSGGGGRGGSAGTLRVGGTGGGGGAYARTTIAASDLAASVSITVPVAAIGGAGGSSANGVNGSAPAATTFGSHLSAFSGGAGTGGDATGNTGGGGGGGTASIGQTSSLGATAFGGDPRFGATENATHTSGGGGGGGVSAAGGAGNAEYGGGGGGGATSVAVAAVGGNSLYAAGGGGGGGGVTSGNAETVGAKGGGSRSYTPAVGNGGVAGAVNGGSGGAGATGSGVVMGAGGGGGGGQDSGTGGVGGDGGIPGGGGGGGGGGTTTGGGGGAGGRGEVRIYTYF